MKKIVIVVGEESSCEGSLAKELSSKYDVISLINSKETESMYESIHNKVDAVIIKHPLMDNNIVRLVKKLKDIDVIPEIIVVSTNEDIETKATIELMKHGVYDLLIKPSINQVVTILKKATENTNFLENFKNIYQKVFYEKLAVKKQLEVCEELLRKRKKEGSRLSRDELVAFMPSWKDIEEIYPKVLVVEDEENALRMLETMLVRGGYNVLLARNSKEALAQLKKTRGIDLILLDIGLPDINGVELMPSLFKIDPDISIVMVTAFRDNPVVVDSFKNEACEYITKPYEYEDLMQKVEFSIKKKYRKQFLGQLGETMIDEVFEEKTRLKLLEELAKKREEEEQKLYMEDIYVFFPALKNSGISDKEEVPAHYLEEGIFYFIEELKSY